MPLRPGNVGQLTAIARDSAGNVLSLQNRNVQWFSSNIPIANVTGQGVVTAHNVGTADITVSVDGVISGPVTVTVTNPYARIDGRGDRQSLPVYANDELRIRDPRSSAGWFDSFRK